MEKNKNSPVILLTATITPNSFSNLSITDPEIRRQQYLDALNFYIKKTDLKIIFVENSYDSLPNFPSYPERLEYLKFKSEPTEPDRGIGFKEIEILDYAFQNSKFINEAKSIVKITGRLKVLNIRFLIRKFLKNQKQKNNLVYINSFAHRNMDARCFFFTKDFWLFLKEEGEKINIGYNFEFSLWDATSKYRKITDKYYVPISFPLRIKGISGSFGIIYKHSHFYHYARIIRIMWLKQKKYPRGNFSK